MKGIAQKAQMTLLKLILTAVSLAVALTPLWLFTAAKFLLAPQGFWQNFLLLGIGFYFLGALQLFLMILWLAFMLNVILN